LKPLLYNSIWNTYSGLSAVERLRGRIPILRPPSAHVFPFTQRFQPRVQLSRSSAGAPMTDQFVHPKRANAASPEADRRRELYNTHPRIPNRKSIFLPPIFLPFEVLWNTPMPITARIPIRRLSQSEFGDIAYYPFYWQKDGGQKNGDDGEKERV
jgi:hypothetical protein